VVSIPKSVEILRNMDKPMADLLKEHKNGEHRHSAKSPIRIVMNEFYETSIVGVCDIDTSNEDDQV